MNFLANMHSRDFLNPTDTRNSICLGGPEHMLITSSLFDGDSFRIAEMPSISVFDSPYSSYIQESNVNIYTYNKKMVHIGGFRAYIYVYSEVSADQIDDWIESYFDAIYYRIRYNYDTGNYEFFNLPYERSSDNWEPPMTYAPYIPFNYHWYPPAGWDRGKLKEKKLQLKLDDKLFEL